jgi:UDP-glucose 4-epimerase
MKILIAGASGYYGTILTKFLINEKIDCIGIDLIESNVLTKEKQILCDICNYKDLETKLEKYNFNVIIHLASQIDFAVHNQNNLYQNNILSTKNLLKVAEKHKIKTFIFTSSNSIFLGLNKTLILDTDKPIPIDMYGKSKFDSENYISKYKNKFNVLILRCPNIIDAGRVGMMSILFDLVRANATLWVIKNGQIKHQCLYAQDLNLAIKKLLFLNISETYNIGSENVSNFKEIFQNLINVSKSKSKVRSIPSGLAIFLLKFLYKIRLSPMGPYQFRMLTMDFEFDISKIKKQLNWKPTKTNTEIIRIAYDFYIENINNPTKKLNANSRPVNMKILNILKLIKW